MTKEDVDLIIGRDLLDPATYKLFVATRKENHQPIPPGRDILMAGHHWLKENRQLTGSADQGSWMVAHWSPTELRWYHSNDVGTCMKPLNGDGIMQYWEWQAAIPLPDIE